MPPRIPASRLAQPPKCQCSRTRQLLGVPQEPSHARQLHTSPRHGSKLRRDMFQWLNGAGKAFRDPKAGSTNYLSAYDKMGNLKRAGRPNNRDQGPSEEAIVEREKKNGLDAEQMMKNAEARAEEKAAKQAEENDVPKERAADMRPYPLNHGFRSQPVLSEELREQLYHQVEVMGLGLDTVASSFGVDMRRVAAVVRLKTIEKQWVSEGKELAKPYSEAVLGMLPKTPYLPDSRVIPHETINDLPVHPRTRQQIFYPTSESRKFTREDAAKAFDPTLLPADKRIPLPVLVKLEKWNLEDLPREERQKRLREDDMKEKLDLVNKVEKKAAWEQRTQRVVPGKRWDFKFQDISAEKVDKNGKGRDAVGYRYGMPHEDRKRGLVKIPTSVE